MASKPIQEKFKNLKNSIAENAELQYQVNKKEIEPERCRVVFNLPTFWSDKPAIWFAQVEALFHIYNIVGDTTKYNYIVGHLDQRFAGEMEDLIINTPTEDKYESIKHALIKRFSVSQEKRFRQLLSGEELGDRTPSQFLRHLRSLAGGALSDDNITSESPIWEIH